MAAVVEELEECTPPFVKRVLTAATSTPLPTWMGAPAPFRRTPRESAKMSEKVTDPLLKPIVFALEMLLPVTPMAVELALRPDRAVENEKGIVISYQY